MSKKTEFGSSALVVVPGPGERGRRAPSATSRGVDEEQTREQEYVSMLHDRLDALRASATAGLRRALADVDPTSPNALTERDVTVGRYTGLVTRYDAVRDRLCFGRLDMVDGQHRYIGRIGILDPDADYDPLLIDWRAPAARPFYTATGATPLDVARRRHIRTLGRRVLALDDETLAASGPDGDGSALLTADRHGRTDLVGEAALMAALDAERTGRMRDIVETIQAEQDRIIRSPHTGVLVVDGGPGTGKTTVALHRAAYLLYTHREILARRGVLVVGPNRTFLRYVEQVLPSLGETGVLLSTVGDLFPDVRPRRTEPTAVSEIKGRPVMVDVLAAAVRDRQRLPAAPVKITVADGTVVLDADVVASARDTARRTGRSHNLARPIFVRELIAELARRLVDSYQAAIDEVDVPELSGGLPVLDPPITMDELSCAADESGDPDISGIPGIQDTPDYPAGRGGPGDIVERPARLFDTADLADLRQQLRAEPALAAAVDELWPLLTPQRLLSDLFASPDLLASAADMLSEDERACFAREAGSGWTPADAPLLDEAAELLGEDPVAADAARAAAEAARDEQVSYARGVLDILAREEADDPDDELLMAADVIDADRFAERHEEADGRTTAERAAADRTWAFGHLIVDEAQELSWMAWRMLMRRCPSRSMTLVGDVAQTGDPAGTDDWGAVLDPYVADRWRLARLTVNYRTGEEIMEVAADVLAARGQPLVAPQSARRCGNRPWRCLAAPTELVDRVTEVVGHELARLGGGRLAVIAPEGRLDDLAGLPEVFHGGDSGDGDDAGRGGGADDGGADDDERGQPDLLQSVVVLGVRAAKGLEFDAVVVVEPERILVESARGAGDLYVALTRATRRLAVVHTGPLPAMLARLAPADEETQAGAAWTRRAGRGFPNTP